MAKEARKQALTGLQNQTQDPKNPVLTASAVPPAPENSKLIASLTTPDLLEQVKTAYGPAIRSRMASLLGKTIPIQFELSGTRPAEAPAEQTLDQFITGESNLLAYKAVCSAGKNGRPSPLILEGPSGCGKTHLLNALALVVRGNGQSALKLGSVELRDRFLAALHQQRVPGLKQEWRGFDALLIDDLQLLASAPATLEEISHLVTHYLDAGRVVAVTTDRPIVSFLRDARLVSRLSSGLTTLVEHPDLEMRIHMVRQIADSSGIALERSEVERIAEQPATYRSLCSVIGRMALQEDTTAQVPTDMDRVIDAVCSAFQINPEDLRGSSRKSEHAGPRHAAMVLALQHTRMTKSYIARFFGKKDHTTVIHAEKKVAERIKTSKAFRRGFEDALRRLNVDNLSESTDNQSQPASRENPN